MNEMIKRVSKAILETSNASDYAELVAKNAIRAMREPTDKMIGSGIRNGIDQGFGCGYDDYKLIYQAMIDEALK